MRRLEYFAICKSVSLDAMTGEISLFHVTHHVNIPIFPTRIPSLCAVASWIDNDRLADPSNSVEASESHIKLNVISPGGAPVNTFRRTLRSPNRMDQSVFRVVNIPITSEGELVVELVVDDSTVAHHTVLITQKGPHNKMLDVRTGNELNTNG